MSREAESEEVFDLLSLIYSSPKAGQVIGGRWTRSLVNSELQNGHVIALRETSGFLRAMILYRGSPDHFEVSFLGTHPKFERQGLMKRLIARMQAEAVSSKKQIWLEVHSQNTGARGFYLTQGFEQTGLRPKYYADGGDAILLTWSPDGVSKPQGN